MPLLPEIGDNFSGCKILARCGNGSFGVTFLARNLLGKQVIIKIISASCSCERELEGVRNYMLVAGKHPNLLQIFHVGELQEGFFYIMEAADDCGSGQSYYPATLGNFFRKGKTFTPAEAVAITRGLLSGLKVMHQENLIHRDIKPDNIIFVNNIPKLSDPGLVIQVGQEASFAGTLGFIPPEMLDKETPANQQSDLYAMGKVFYCMVTGNRPRDYPVLPENMPLEICRQLYPPLSRMCNLNPEKRFRNVDEFLAGLPEELESPNLIERLWDDFRNWKILNRSLYRTIKCSIVLLLTLLIAAGSGFAGFRIYKDRQDAAIQKELALFMKINSDRRDLIKLQLQTYLPQNVDGYLQLNEALENARKNADWQLVRSTQKKLLSFLQTSARMLIPELPGNAQPAQAAAAVGNMYGFLAAPLVEYLPENEKKQLQKKLSSFNASSKLRQGEFRIGASFDTFQQYYLPLEFIPPGAVTMDHNQKTVRIPYYFWMGKYELGHEHFCRMMGITPQRSRVSNTPVERVSWNDILFYCYKITVLWQRYNVLPDGYIVRPPTEAEWEYAAKNHWLGADTTPLTERARIDSNSEQRTWAHGSKSPGRAGLYDMYGNVSEIVQPIEKPAMAQAVIIRGGSYRSTEKQCANQRIEYLKYQYIPYDIGVRLAVAPGDLDYFDREFLDEVVVQNASRGRIYELFGVNVGAFNWEKSDTICCALGGRLAEFDDYQHFSDLKKQMPLLGAWTTFIGGVKRNDKWVWQSSGKPLDFGSWKNASMLENSGDRLALTGYRWEPVKEKPSAIFLCQWTSQEYQQIKNILPGGKKLPYELKRFSIGPRNFVLIDSSMHFFTAKRICELLGGNLAVLDTPEIREQVKAQLKEFTKHHILLGGYAKRYDWYWLNGSKIDFTPEAPPSPGIPTVNLNFLILHDGKFYNNQSSSSFLCEWRTSSDSSH